MAETKSVKMIRPDTKATAFTKPSQAGIWVQSGWALAPDQKATAKAADKA